MSQKVSEYEVIARKWRPQKFDEIIGQDHVRQTLENALKNHRLHHSILLTGPRGTGKTSTARVLAKSLRCTENEKQSPCNVCSNCLEVTEGRSMDVIEIDGASNNGVDAIRELRDTVGYMPSSGKFKVYIIDEVHMLSTSAFNALLKTLEEPPEHVTFIMATTEVHKIPNTILSRSQRFDFRRISTTAIVEHLKKISSSENVKVEEAALWSIAKAGDGSMRDSQSLLDQMITFSGQNLTLEHTTEVLGLTSRQLLIDCVRAFMNQDAHLTLSVLEKISMGGVDSKVFLNDLLQEIRHLLVIKVSGKEGSRLIDLSQSEVDELFKMSSEFGEADLHLLFDLALKGVGDLARSQDQQTVLEMILLRMTRVSRISKISDFIANQPALKGQPTEKKTQTSVKTSPSKERGFVQGDLPPQRGGLESETNSQASVSSNPTPAPDQKTKETTESHKPPEPSTEPTQLDPTTDLSRQWSQFVRKISPLNPLVAASLENISLTGVQGTQLFLKVSEKKKFIYDKAIETEFREKMARYFLSFWGQKYTYQIDFSEKSEKIVSPREVLAAEKHERASALKKSVTEHPLVKEAQTLFKAEIKSIKEVRS